MLRVLYTNDHPQADGKTPAPGTRQWTFTFLLDGGDDYLELHVGRKARDAFQRMFEQEVADDTEDDSVNGGGI